MSVGLVLAGLPLMLEGRKKQPTEQKNDWRSVIVVPLTFPLSVGGATAAMVITSGSRFGSVPDLWSLAGVE